MDLHIAIPQGSLEDQFPYQYPLSKKSNSWLAVIDEWFIVLAKAIYEEIPFEGALIGEEVSGLYDNDVDLVCMGDICGGKYYYRDNKKETSLSFVRVRSSFYDTREGRVY